MSAEQTEQLSTGRQYVNFEEFIDFHLQKTRTQVKATDVATAVVLCALGLLGYVLLFVVADHWLIPGGWPGVARWGMLTVVLGVIGAILVRRVIYPLSRSVNSLYAAREIERTDPSLKGTLLTFVELKELGREETGDGAVSRAVEKKAAVALSKVDVDHAVDRLPLLRLSYALLAVVAVSCLYVVLSPKDPFPSVRRALLPASEVSVATRTTISDLSPGDVTLPARSQLTVEADVRGQFVGPVQLLYTTADRSFVDQPLEMRRIDEGLPRFRGMIAGPNGKGLLQDLTYRIEAGDARTVDYAVRVVQPPSARVDEIRLVHPNYMQISPKTTPGGAIDGWEGAQVTLKATANMPVKSALVLLFDSEDAFARSEKGEQISSVRIEKGTELTATWTLSLRSDGTFARYYRLQVETANGARDPEPTQYPIKIRPDQPPEIALLHPTSDLERPANITLPLAIQASDADFGLRTIALRMEKNGEGLPDVRLFEDQELGQSIRGRYDWDLARMGLKAGDVVQFWLEARDTKQPNANKRVTNRLNLKIVPPISPQEAKQQLAEDKQAQQDQLAQADPERDQPPEAPAEAQPEEGTPQPPAAAPARPDAKRPQGDNKNEPAGNEPPAADKPEQPEVPAPEDKQPADDSKALERFIRELEQEQQRPGNPEQPPEKPEGEPGAEGENQPGQPEGDQPAADRPENQPPGKSKPGQNEPGKQQPGKTEPGKKQPGQKQPQQGEGAAGQPGQPEPGQPDNGARPKGEPPANQPGRKTGGENQPSKQPNPNDGSDTEPAEPGKTPSQTRERPGTDEATGANSPTPSNTGKPSPNRSTNPKGPPEKGGKPGEATEPTPQEPGAETPGDKKPGDKKTGENKKPGGGKPGDNKAGEKEGDGTATESLEGTPSKGEPSKSGTKPTGDPQKNGKPGEAEKGPPGEKGRATESKPGEQAGQPEAKPGENPAGKGPGPKPAGKSGKEPGKEPGANEPRPDGDPSAPREQPAGNEPGDGSDPSPKKPGDGQRDGGKGGEKPKSKPGQTDEPMPEGTMPDEGGDAAGESGGKPDNGAKPKPGEAPKPGAVQPEPGQPGAAKPTEKPGRPEAKPAPEGDKPAAEEGDPQSEDPQSKDPEANPGSKPANRPGKPGTPKEGAGDKPNEKPAGRPAAKPGQDQGAGDPSAEKPEGGEAGQKQPGKPGQAGQNEASQGEEKGGMDDAPEGAAGKDGEKAGEKSGGKDGTPGKKPGPSGSPDGKPGQPDASKGQPGGKQGEGKPGQGKPGEGKAGQGEAGSDEGGANSPAGETPGEMPEETSPAGKAPQEGGPQDKQPDSKTEPGKAAEKGNGGGQKPGGKDGGGKDAGGEQGGAQPGKSGGSGQPGGKGEAGGEGESGAPSPGGDSGQGGSGRSSDGSNGKIGSTDRPRGDRDRSGEGGDAPGEEGDSDRPVPGEALTKDEKADAAKLEYTKKASNLVLQRLKEQLERGEVDPETLKELGWTKDELAKFVDRLEKRIEAAEGEEDTPEAVARRMQFEEELKQLRVGSDVKKRSESGGVQRRTNITNKQAPVPPELRDQYDAYTKGLSKTGGAKTGGGKPGDGAKPGVPSSR